MDFDAVRSLKALFIGDGIIDEYRYVRPLGKSLKENALSVAYDGESEEFRGGVWALADHARGFCNHVDVYAGPTVMRNIRYVEQAFNRKLFSLHQKLTTPRENLPDLHDYDLIVVADFGHGCMDKLLVKRVLADAKFLAVMAQTNTQNFGFNLVTKYPGANLLVVDELEARLALGERDAPLEEIIGEFNASAVIVTRGTKGAMGYAKGMTFEEPAIAAKVVDTMGAGDAFLAVASLFAATDHAMPDLLRIGNAAAAVKCAAVGQKPVTKEELCQLLAN